MIENFVIHSIICILVVAVYDAAIIANSIFIGLLGRSKPAGRSVLRFYNFSWIPKILSAIGLVSSMVYALLFQFPNDDNLNSFFIFVIFVVTFTVSALINVHRAIGRYLYNN
jgi:hypothetical protein